MPPRTELPTNAWPAHAAFSVLVFSRTTGYRHASIPAGVTAIQVLGAYNNFTVEATEDPTAFSDANLARFGAVVFLSTTGEVLDDAQQAAFERYIQAGHGLVGVHSASDTEYGWSWYHTLLGVTFASHPAMQQASVVVVDTGQRSTRTLPDPWVRTDEWYNYTALPVSVSVLVRVDETTYSGGTMETHIRSAGSANMTVGGRGTRRWDTRRAVTASGPSSTTCSAASSGRRGFPERRRLAAPEVLSRPGDRVAPLAALAAQIGG